MQSKQPSTQWLTPAKQKLITIEINGTLYQIETG